MTLREKRYQEAMSTLTRITAQRDAAIASLIRTETRLKALRKQAARLERAMAEPVKAKPEPAPKAAPAPKPAVATVTDIPVSELPIADSLDVPDFLRRKKDGDKKDAETAAAADRSKIKARNRIDTMKAKQRGDTKRMPLSGREAIAAIMAK